MRGLVVLLGASVTALAGCSQAPPSPWVSSAEVQKLTPELQQAVRKHLVEHCGTVLQPKLLGQERVPLHRLLEGQAVYQKRCVQCHGATGDGAGPTAAHLYPRPRDYRRGMFKFTSTRYGSKPRREDLLRTLRAGVPGTSMPSFDLLSEAELESVVDYILALTHRGELEFLLALEADGAGELAAEVVPEFVTEVLDAWARAEEEQVLALTPQPRFTPEHIAAGKAAFLSKGCSKCHGEDGRGQTPDNLRGDLKDFWGHATRAADLTSGMLRGGRQPFDVYRRIFAGINGTPMPAFDQSLAQEPETVWNLVSYVLYVSNQRRSGVNFPAGNLAPFVTSASPGQAAPPATDSE